MGGAQLCTVQRRQNAPLSDVVLPALYFQLEDDQAPMPPRIGMSLERLVFTNESGVELLCIARSDDDDALIADMIFSHIAFGSLAVAAMYTAVNLENHTVGLWPRGDLEEESTNAFCAQSAVCQSSMQTLFPPLNICEDPDCSNYMFMVLDDETRMCRWNRIVPMAFGFVLFSLFLLDLLSHRLYKQAIGRATEFCQ